MGFKSEILKIARSIPFTEEEFNAVGIHEWSSVLKKVESNFLIKSDANNQFNWWWESFKGQQTHKSFHKDDGWTYLNQLIDLDEKVWFIGSDDARDPTKFWLFQGYIEPIQKVLSEMYLFEYYIVSKKYKWLLCENHHSTLVGLGTIREKLEGLNLTNNGLENN